MSLRSGAVLIFCILRISLNAQVQPVISESSLAADKEYSVQAWTTENGLPQNSVNDIAQTKDGYLWLATFDGLVRFDGLRFSVFNTGNTPQFKTNGIKKLFTDNENRLWIINAEGELFLFSQNKFSVYHLPAKLSITSNVIADFKNESVLVLCSNNKFYKLKDGRFTEVRFGEFKQVNAIQTINNEQLFIATGSGMFSYINDQLNEFADLKGMPVNQLYASPNSDVIAQSGNNIYSLRSSRAMRIQMPAGMPDPGTFSIGFNDKKQLCLLTESGVIVTDGNKFSILSPSIGLSSGSIRSMMVDQENNLWIGTNNGGLDKLKPKLFKTLSKEDGLLDDGVTAILESKTGSVYIGNGCGGVSEFHNGKFLHELKQPKDRCVWSLMEDTEQNLWMGTYGGGVYIYKKNGEIRNYTAENGLSANVVFSIFQDNEKKIWLGTSGGLSSFTANKFSLFDTSFRHSITHIMEDRSGTLWLCTDAGLATIIGNKIVLLEKDKGFRFASTRYIYEDAEGVLWVGTHGNGLVRVKNGKTFYYSDHTTQLDKNVWSIAEDKNGKLWLPSNAGMYVADKKELNELADNNSGMLNPIYLSKEDGLKSIEFNGGFQPAMLQSNTGEFWFPTVKGTAIVDPQLLKPAAGHPVIIIEKINADDRPVSFNHAVHLQTDSKVLSLMFTAPAFSASAKLCFEYQLQGADNTWISIGTAREIRITDIPTGTHMLRIRITGAMFSETGILLDKPAVFWKNTRFIVIASITSVVFMLLISFFFVRYMRKREMIKTRINRQYANIELKALQAQMNPHFIFNCLNSIQHFIILNDEVSASKYLTKFSMLMRKFLEHSKSTYVTLQEEIELLRLYVELEALRSRDKFDFRLKIADEIDIFNIEIPGMLFQPFVENAIAHGLMNKEDKGSLLLTFEMKDSHVIGTIEDDGIGRKKSAELNKKSYKDHASRGMEIINERIAVLNYIENIKIEVEVTDKLNDKAEPCGTKIIIKIPI